MTEPVGIVGAGGAGLAAARALQERRVPWVAWEAGSGLGGNWRYESDSGRSSCYASLTTNTSRLQTAYSGFPLRRRGPAFVGHREMLAYLESFARRFGLLEHIRFGAPVEAARPRNGGGWTVTAGGERTGVRALVVATGFNSVPVVPEYPGRLDGPVVHTHHYRTPEPFRDLDVVVVGLGCSAGELACELRGVARSVTLSARSAAWVVPKRLGPMPLDWVDSKPSSRLPWRLRRRMFAMMIRMAGGGLLVPPGASPRLRPGDKPFAVSDDLHRAVRSGQIPLVREVVELLGDRVRLADGQELRAGALLLGTGYEARYEFLPDDVPAPTLERAPLYRGVTSLDVPDLHFVGLVGGHGGLIPMFDAQAAWLGEVLAGRLRLPAPEVMRASVAADAAIRDRDFDPRFGILFDRLAYVRSLTAEARAAVRRPGTARRAAAATV